MRVGDVAYLVGWICVAEIYGESTETLKADHYAAFKRKQMLVRRTELLDILHPFVSWTGRLLGSKLFDKFDRICDELYDKAYWIYENGTRREFYPSLPREAELPRSMFNPSANPKSDLSKAHSELHFLENNLLRTDMISTESVTKLKRTLSGVIARVQNVIRTLSEPVSFFQPSILADICASAATYNVSQKRFFVPGLNSITCKRKGKSDIVIALPPTYVVPDLRPIEELKEKLQRL